ITLVVARGGVEQNRLEGGWGIFAELIADFLQAAPIGASSGARAQGNPSFREFGTQMDCLAPFFLGLLRISGLFVGDAEMIVAQGVIRSGFYGLLQGGNSLVGLIAANFDLALQHQHLGIRGRLLQNCFRLGVRFIDAVVQNQELDVGFANGEIGRVFGGKRRKFREGFVILPARQIGLTEEFVGVWVAAQLFLGFGEDLFALGFLPLAEIERSERTAGSDIFWRCLDGILEYLFGFRPALVFLIESAQGDSGQSASRVQGYGFFETLLGATEIFLTSLNVTQ